MNVKTNVGKTFLKLLQCHFPKRHPMHKIFNRNTVKISYCCMRNMESVISSHNKQILNPSKEYFGSNCRVRNECPFDNKCLTPNIVHEATVSNKTNNEFKDILVLQKHHSKKDSGTILETSSIKSMRSALNFQSIFGL